MPAKITLEVAKERFAKRKDIKLIKFTGWKSKSKFYDLIINEYFWELPSVVYQIGQGHPKRGRNIGAKKRSLPIETVRERFKDRNDIKICEDTYVSWDKKAKFYDFLQRDYFYAVPKKVYTRKSVHPNRANRNRKEKLKISSKEAKKRFDRQRNDIVLCEKTYIKWSSKAKFYDKVANDYFWSIPNDVLKLKTVHPKRRNEKKKKTYNKNWGVDNFSKTQQFIKMHKQRSLSNPNSICFSKRLIKENGMLLKDWYKQQPEPKPAYSNLKQLIPNEPISIKTIEYIFKCHAQGKTNLERAVESIFETKHYNKKPKQIKKLYRPDFKLSPRIFLNADGLYWHSEIQKDKKYHFNLRKEFEENGLRIFQFREDEVQYKPEIVKSIVDNAIGKTPNKIFARKCTIEQVTQKKTEGFLENNHLMGSINAKHLGLYYNNQLISILSYKQKNNICKIERFCSLNSHSIVGGFSKLLSHLEKECINPETKEIHNWVDLRYGTGEHLKAKGFETTKETLGWKWTDFISTYNRLKCRAKMDKRQLTQQQYANELGWVKIYDAGQRLYIKSLIVSKRQSQNN